MSVAAMLMSGTPPAVLRKGPPSPLVEESDEEKNPATEI